MIKAVELLVLTGRIDWRSMRGDPFLLWLAAMPFAYALAIRLGLPYLDGPLQQGFGIGAAEIAPILGAGLLMLAPSCAGIVVGFLLLDERDLHVMSAIRVTPCPPSIYLARRLFWPCLVGVAVGLVSYAASGLPHVPPPALLMVSVVASLAAPAMALTLGALAGNKVQGLALLKVANAIGLVPVLAFFLQDPWRYVAVILPTAWPVLGYWHALEGKDYVLDCLGGVVFMSLLIAALHRLFERKA